MDNYLALIAVALCVAAISFTVTITSMFKWLLELLSKIHPKVEELIHCPWCFGHWVTFAILLTASKVRLLAVTDTWFYNFMFTAFVVMGMAGLVLYVLLRAFEPVLKAMLARQIENARKKNSQ